MFKANKEGGECRAHCLIVSLQTGKKSDSLWKTAASMQAELPQVAWQAYRCTCKTHGHTYIQSWKHIQDKHHTYTYKALCAHLSPHAASITMSTLQIIDHEGSAQPLQTPIPIHRVKQICSVLTELSSDVTLLLSYHQAILKLWEHHKAVGNTDNMLQVYIQHTVSRLWQTMLWLCYKQTNFHVFRLDFFFFF